LRGGMSRQGQRHAGDDQRATEPVDGIATTHDTLLQICGEGAGSGVVILCFTDKVNLLYR
jgi:hypothetical protein